MPIGKWIKNTDRSINAAFGYRHPSPDGVRNKQERFPFMDSGIPFFYFHLTYSTCLSFFYFLKAVFNVIRNVSSDKSSRCKVNLANTVYQN